MKKLIKIGTIFFSLSPIVAIASTPSNSPASVSLQFKLVQFFKTKLTKSFKNSQWIEQAQSDSGSNIIDGENGTIFEDSLSNLWSMGAKTKLQKYNYDTGKWTEETIDSSGSNIIDGFGGTIFEDSIGNLWSMGKGTKLQKYNHTTWKWTEETSESSGSNIANGEGGAIFEDSRGNLWSMGYGTKLQKYNDSTKRWTEETSESSGSNITNGSYGIIFEDSRGNLWSMGFGTPLQKYNYTTKIWTVETIKSSGSNITNGGYGTIFEDSRGNLWSMGFGTKMQKYNYITKRWTTQTSDSNGSNIINGSGGTIFEDSLGNLWSMGYGTKLQKYNYDTKRWTEETSDSSGSNLTNGGYGTIFEDSYGNIWSAAEGTKLQKYNCTTKRWTEETSDSNGSNIISGQGGTIFEDSRGNLWSLGKATKLQKLITIDEDNPVHHKVKDFNIEFKVRINPDSKIAILIKGYKKSSSGLFTHLRYKKKAESSWKVIKKRTTIIDAAKYEFEWILGHNEYLPKGQKLPQKISISIQPNDIAKVKMFLSGLSRKDIDSLANPTKLVSEITKDEILAKIRLASDYNSLTDTQKELVNKELISTFEDPNGTLKVTINFESGTYELIKDGFKLTLQAEANKFQDFTSTDTIKSNAARLKVSPKNVVSIFKKISGYQKPANLASDISITKVIVKNALNSQTQKVTFELTISRQNEVEKKDVNVTFNKALKVISNPSKKDTSGLSTGAIVGTIFGSIFGIGIIGFLIFYFVKGNKKTKSKK